MTIKGDKNLYWGIYLLCLIRPDGVVWSAGLLMYRFIIDSKKIQSRTEFFRLFYILIIPGLIYFLWRCWYFSEWLPLPFIVKGFQTRDYYHLFFNYSISRVSQIIWPFIFILTVNALTSPQHWTKKGRILLSAFLIFIPSFLFYSSMMLEQNIGNRFCAPFFFGILFFLCNHCNMGSLIIFSIWSIISQYSYLKDTINQIKTSKDENIYYVAKELSKLQGRMLISEAGRLAYYSGWYADDSWGLNTPEYAHKLIRSEDINEKNYDLIVGHCDITILHPHYNELSDGSKTWMNQCRTLVNYVKKNAYDVYLVPFRKDVHEKCQRYDIYAIKQTYSQYESLRAILLKYGAVSAKQALPYRGGLDLLCLENDRHDY